MLVPSLHITLYPLHPVVDVPSMSPAGSTTGLWKDVEQRPLQYSSWMLFERKGTMLFLLLGAATISFTFGHATHSPFFGTAAFGLFLFSIWRSFIPVYFEINANGIVRRTFGKKKFVAWEKIRSYQTQSNGILLFTHSDRYPLEPFQGLFLPVPELHREDVLYRFMVFVDRT